MKFFFGKRFIFTTKKATPKSNIEKYVQDLIEDILSEFPEISEKIEEEILAAKIKESENINIFAGTTKEKIVLYF